MRVQVSEISRASGIPMESFMDAVLRVHDANVDYFFRKLDRMVFHMNSPNMKAAEQWAAVAASELVALIQDGVQVGDAFVAVVEKYGAPWLDPGEQGDL
jgi:hypothetical protein